MHTPEVPETLEGWYIQHDMFTVNWPQWRALKLSEQAAVIEASAAWLDDQAISKQGNSAFFSLMGHKGDLLLVHFRPSLEALNKVKLSLRQTPLFTYLQPVYGYLSVVELGLYEVIGAVQRKLAEAGLEPGTADYDQSYQQELALQKEAMHERLYPDPPEGRYLCFYPMNKKRGDVHNWYVLSMDERRQLMRGHGLVGRKYAGQVKQIISGSVGLDDWEWGVSLFADDPLVFKKLIYEMRFDAASALYAEFGEFYVGIRFQPNEIGGILTGHPSG
ncbi:MAG: hydrogen peroxide-dependent heme synthase [Candidatus Tectomicrobia bacterium]